MVTVSVLLSSGQCIHRVMRLVVWGGVERYERCMTSRCMREHCMFLTVVILPLFSASRMCCGTDAQNERFKQLVLVDFVLSLKVA